jgi:hypothetical protein
MENLSVSAEAVTPVSGLDTAGEKANPKADKGLDTAGDKALKAIETDFEKTTEEMTEKVEQVSVLLPVDPSTEFEAKAIELVNRVVQYLLSLEIALENLEDIEVFASSDEVENLELVLEEVADLFDTIEGETTELQNAIAELVEICAENYILLETLADLTTFDNSEDELY